MRQYIWAVAVVITFASFCSITEARNIVKRQAGGPLDPVHHEIDHDDQYRDKRKVEATFGVKNAVLGLVFNKINSFIDQKTQWVSQLDRQNIAKNRAHGIEAPKDPIVSLSGIISGVIGSKLQAAAPLITVVTNKLTSGSSSGGHTGFNIGSLLGGFSGGIGGGVGNGGAHVGVTASAGY